MRVGAVSGFLGMDQYRISSIHGNPASLRPIERLQAQNEQQTNKPFVIAQKEPSSSYVKEFGDLPKTTNTAMNGFAEIFAMQSSKLQESEEVSTQKEDAFSTFLMDTIGMMGMKTQLRSQLGAHL